MDNYSSKGMERICNVTIDNKFSHPGIKAQVINWHNVKWWLCDGWKGSKEKFKDSALSTFMCNAIINSKIFQHDAANILLPTLKKKK